MFERFTERARQVIVLAQEEARTLRHGFIGTEHLLLGVIREEEGLAAVVLFQLNVKYERVREAVEREYADRVGESPEGQIPLTIRAKKIIEGALREALSLGHNYIGTEHVLLALSREHEGLAARILADLDADPEKVRNAIIYKLNGHQEPPSLEEVVAALRVVREAESAADEAQEHRRKAELQLAELLNVRRRDKDMAFDAVHNAEQFIVAHALGAGTEEEAQDAA